MPEKTARSAIRLRSPGGVKANPNLMSIRLNLQFDPVELGPDKTDRLLSGLITAVSDVVDPAQRKEMARQLEVQKRRFARAG
jgi:hypothetical protein